MPYLIWIHNKDSGPPCDRSVEFVIAHTARENREFDTFLGRRDARLLESFFQNRNQLSRKCAAGRPQQFEPERYAVFVPNAVTIMIDPPCLIQQFTSAFGIVRQRFYVCV